MGHDLGHGNGMEDVGFPGFTAHAPMSFIGHTECLPDHTLIGFAIAKRTVIQQVIELLLDQVFLCFCQDSHRLIPEIL
jgi:hypothetical protein